MDNQAISIKVTGKVQGVWFRDYTCRAGQSLGLTGFVRNEADGSVYAEAEGPKEKLDEFVAAVKKGSPLSRVEKVFVNELPVTGQFIHFEIRYGH